MTENDTMAFPMACDDRLYQEGMTLRDYFAAKCIYKLCSISLDEQYIEDLATISYMHADAMLKARIK